MNKNQQSNGDYEVHQEDCKYMPEYLSRELLGDFDECKEAVEAAKEMFPNKSRINGCYFCCNDCHVS